MRGKPKGPFVTLESEGLLGLKSFDAPFRRHMCDPGCCSGTGTVHFPSSLGFPPWKRLGLSCISWSASPGAVANSLSLRRASCCTGSRPPRGRTAATSPATGSATERCPARATSPRASGAHSSSSSSKVSWDLQAFVSKCFYGAEAQRCGFLPWKKKWKHFKLVIVGYEV